MNVFRIERKEELKDFYVWFDPLLEELFSMETHDLEAHVNLKNQLLKEKVVFHLVKARSWTHSFEVYRNNQLKNNNRLTEDTELNMFNDELTIH